jgi:hypothetical protein
MLWIAGVLCLNLLPVVLLRLSLTPATSYPTLRDMNFVRDQHKFSDWVYLAASANMCFWVLGSWAVFSAWHTMAALGTVLAIACVATFAPVFIRGESARSGGSYTA